MKSDEFKFIDLRIDWAFKYVYGTRGNEDLLLQLLTAILPEKRICKVSLCEQEQMPDSKEQRKAVFDVNCTTENQESFIIEMQYAEQNDFANRMMYYSGFPIRNYVRSGDKDRNVYKFKPVYVIGILNFLMPGISQNGNVINRYSVRNDAHPYDMLFDDWHCITVELPKLGDDPKKLSASEMQLYVIKNSGSMSSRPDEFKSKSFDKLFGVINFASMSEKDQEMYESEFRWILNRNSEMATAIEKGLQLGQTQGRAQGIAQGRAQGIAEGRAEGRAEGIQEGKLETARSMKADGMSSESICKYTGLTLEQIAEL